jgi:pimeloyl-ACP methyl ester carboxylesterase
MAELALQQATIEYQEFGPQDSPHAPILFVHGILVDGRLWREVAEGLARRGFRCIVPTWPLGSHTIPVKDAAALSLPGVAEMINDAIVAFGLSDVTLVGGDTGGGLCQLVVDAYPDRIGRLVLTNCDAFDKCPPFPFDIVFGLLRGPISIKTLFGQLRLRMLRHSPLGFGLLINHPDPDLTSAWLQPCLKDSRICRDLERCCVRWPPPISPTWPSAYPGSPNRSLWCGDNGTAASPRPWAGAWPACSATGS